MWTIDSSCARCGKKATCNDRVKIIQTLSPLANELNTDPAFTDGPGDGIIIMSCRDFDLEGGQ